ncbi:MAG: hypothetical protein U0263_19905 [Polyangiaceae bacterium]
MTQGVSRPELAPARQGCPGIFAGFVPWRALGSKVYFEVDAMSLGSPAVGVRCGFRRLFLGP